MQLERIYVNKLYSTVQIDSKFTNDKFESEKNKCKNAFICVPFLNKYLTMDQKTKISNHFLRKKEMFFFLVSYFILKKWV